MKSLRLLVFLLLPAFAGPALAEDPVRLTAEEIRSLLSGNTIRGTWRGDEYKQYFMADGATIYAPRRSRSTVGKWRVDPAKNTYDSWWERGGWASYQIIRKSGELFWISQTVPPQPFVVLEGEQLTWTD